MIDSLPSGATSESFANQSVSLAVDALTRCSKLSPASVSGAPSAGVRQVTPDSSSARWSSGMYGLAATVPYWSKLMLRPAAGSVK